MVPDFVNRFVGGKDVSAEAVAKAEEMAETIKKAGKAEEQE